MPNTSKILIVDDDADLRDALSDQLSLHEEFEAAVAENGPRPCRRLRPGKSTW